MAYEDEFTGNLVLDLKSNNKTFILYLILADDQKNTGLLPAFS